MRRRRFVKVAGATLATGVAGCTGDEEGTGNGGGDGGGSDPTYDVGETFTVGNGDKTVEYVVNSVDAYDSIGGSYTTKDADGVWVVVVLEMTNQTGETVDMTSGHLKLVDDQDREFDADAGAGVYSDSDPRIEADSVVFEQLNPGLSTSGAVVFDVNPGASYELLVEPLGYFSSADPKRVALGEISSPE